MCANMVIADEHTIIRKGVSAMINSLTAGGANMESINVDVIGDTDKQETLLNMLSTHSIDLLLLGFGLNTVKSSNPISELDGTALIQWIANAFPATKVIVLSPWRNINLIRTAFEAGAKGFISRTTCERTLWRAITTVLNEEIYIERGLIDSIINRNTLNSKELSIRETDVLRMLCRGLSLTTISARMGISIKTVSAHKLKAMEKLGVDNDCQLYCLISQTQMFDITM